MAAAEGAWSSAVLPIPVPEARLNTARTMERFLADVERRAFRKAEIATGDPEEALDNVQEAMLKLVQRYRRRDPEEWGPLFHQILHSKIRDWYRRTAVRKRWRRWLGSVPEDEADPLQSLADTQGPGPEQRVRDSRTLEALEVALNRLPLRQQEAFLLRAWDGMDVAQTARAMGCSQGSVKTHYARALKALRVALGEHRE